MGYTLRIRPDRERELRAELDRIVNVLRERGDVEKVILFGSLARGEVTSTSDIDLIIVQDTDKPFLERLHDIYSSVVPKKALDVLVYTPDEFQSLKEDRSFVKRALKEGRVLYAKEP